MLQQESKLLVHYYQQRQQHIRAKLSELCTCVDRFSLGAVAMLKTLLRTNDVYLKEANMAHISLTMLQYQLKMTMIAVTTPTVKAMKIFLLTVDLFFLFSLSWFYYYFMKIKVKIKLK